MLELKIKEQNYYSDLIMDIVLDGKVIGGLEGNYQDHLNSFYIENIIRDESCRGKGILKQVIKLIQDKYNCDIGCLPLDKYRPYYESLGFKVYLIAKNGEDIYYKLPRNIQS